MSSRSNIKNEIHLKSGWINNIIRNRNLLEQLIACAQPHEKQFDSKTNTYKLNPSDQLYEQFRSIIIDSHRDSRGRPIKAPAFRKIYMIIQLPESCFSRIVKIARGQWNEGYRLKTRTQKKRSSNSFNWLTYCSNMPEAVLNTLLDRILSGGLKQWDLNNECRFYKKAESLKEDLLKKMKIYDMRLDGQRIRSIGNLRKALPQLTDKFIRRWAIEEVKSPSTLR